jgi:hypothetical protein
MSPGTIYVDYTLRDPIAFLGDYENTAFDEEGYLFPFRPFLAPKALPKVFVGECECSWGRKLQGDHVQQALSLLHITQKMCNELGVYLRQLDVSKADAPSYGQRQIVVIIENREERMKEGKPILRVCPTILRLSTENISQQLANYSVLHAYLRRQVLLQGENATKGFVVDLRIPELAFIAENK